VRKEAGSISDDENDRGSMNNRIGGTGPFHPAGLEVRYAPLLATLRSEDSSALPHRPATHAIIARNTSPAMSFDIGSKRKH